MDLEHTLSSYCMCGLSTEQQFNLATALLYKLVLSASSTSCVDASSPWLSRARVRSHEHSRVLSPSTLWNFDGWRDHSLRRLQIQCFNNSPTVSFVRDTRDPVVLPQDFPVQHDQRLGKITGRLHHGVLRLDVFVHDFSQPCQLVLVSA